ncbi:hypothetical protein ZIOFF_049530 [Zingiber officinale]|uniref:Chromatin target of PRMT1 protein C-terminal domain-containing protein n=1 Tax=Zingiber officinale TaxID=94328 RepID=A0A8J5FT29_ZINOF|nr:hypothetical protein ZIOFF_049530 [Zingiber officinale]
MPVSYFSFLPYFIKKKSKGSAEVVFARRTDAIAAVKRYNNVLLDGKPMKIEIIGTNISTPAVVPQATDGAFGKPNGTSKSTGPARVSPGWPRAGGRGRGRSRGRGKGRSEPVSAEALDADLDNENLVSGLSRHFIRLINPISISLLLRLRCLYGWDSFVRASQVHTGIGLRLAYVFSVSNLGVHLSYTAISYLRFLPIIVGQIMLMADNGVLSLALFVSEITSVCPKEKLQGLFTGVIKHGQLIAYMCSGVDVPVRQWWMSICFIQLVCILASGKAHSNSLLRLTASSTVGATVQLSIGLSLFHSRSFLATD